MESFPTVSFNITDGMQISEVGKSGIQADFSEEALRYTTWDIWNYHISKMREAMLRYNEVRAGEYMEAHGKPLFDNFDPANSRFGVLTGRGRDGSANGSFNVEDLFKAYAFMAEQGHTPDVMIVHPLFFLNGYRNPVLREMLINHGAGDFFLPWDGSPAATAPFQNLGGQGLSRNLEINQFGQANGATPSDFSGREFVPGAKPKVSPQLPFPLTIATSSLVPYDAELGVGSIYLVNSRAVGVKLIDEDIRMVEWVEQAIGKISVRLQQRDALAVMEEGFGIGVFRNVHYTRVNYFSDIVSWTQSAPTTDVPAGVAIP